jgi:hypothetical protein|tara:strand:- start:326 stop:526 length:201 start_codon:yes stop_codon:yes gene_type:complete
LRFDVIEDLLDYVWVNDVGDDTHGAATQRAHGNINIKDSFESLSPGQLFSVVDTRVARASPSGAHG